MSRDRERGDYNWLNNRNLHGQTLAEELAEMLQTKPRRSFKIAPRLKKPIGEVAIRLGAPDLGEDELAYQMDRLQRFSEKNED